MSGAERRSLACRVLFPRDLFVSARCYLPFLRAGDWTRSPKSKQSRTVPGDSRVRQFFAASPQTYGFLGRMLLF